MTEREYRKEYRIHLRSLGLCIHHPRREAVPGSSYCGACLEQRAEWQAQRKARYKAADKCSRCGKPRDDHHTTCAECRTKARNYKARLPIISAARTNETNAGAA